MMRARPRNPSPLPLLAKAGGLKRSLTRWEASVRQALRERRERLERQAPQAYREHQGHPEHRACQERPRQTREL